MFCLSKTVGPNRSQLFYLSRVNDLLRKHPKDIISQCAEILKESLKKVDFNLKDKFRDETDLKDSLENTAIPETFTTFLSTLFDVNEKELSGKPVHSYDTSVNGRNNLKEIKLLRVKSLFQIMYFINRHGYEKTPQHILTGLFLHHATRSKTAITMLNRLGLSICYDEILRIRTRMAQFTKIQSLNNVPLPNHFDINNYVTGAFDNFDHNENTISGLHSTHDTVAVLFQNVDENFNQKKPNISEVHFDQRTRSLTTLLKCQEIKS